MSFRGKRVFRDGKWEDGAAAPELKPPELRELPESYVTKELEDPSKIHALDMPHIVESLTEDLDNAQVAETKAVTIMDVLASGGPPVLRTRAALNQKLVDYVRTRWLARFFEREKELLAAKPEHRSDLNPRHLWFPEDAICKYEVHPGNPPADCDRPKHLQRLDLVLDPLDWPQFMVDGLTAMGVKVPTHEQMLSELHQIKIKNALVHLN